MMGVKYYMATTDAAIDAARTDDRLTEVANETFTYTDSTTDSPVQQRWVVFEVADADIVVPLENQPVVLSDADDHIDGWVYEANPPDAVEGQPKPAKGPGPAVLWYNDPNRWNVLLATSGPDDWQRASSNAADVPVTANPAVEVSDVVVGTDSVSFSVDEVGVPVLVKVSYFPNWTVSGAEGPYRVTPNFMVVVPTEHQVTLSYGRSSVEWLGLLATLVGVALVGWLMVVDHRRRAAVIAAAGGAGVHPSPEELDDDRHGDAHGDDSGDAEDLPAPSEPTDEPQPDLR